MGPDRTWYQGINTRATHSTITTHTLAAYSFRIHSQIDEQDKTETLAFTGSSRSDVEGGIGVFCLFCNNYYQYLKFKPQELIAEIKLSLQQSLFRTWSKSNQFGGLIKRHHMFH